MSSSEFLLLVVINIKTLLNRCELIGCLATFMKVSCNIALTSGTSCNELLTTRLSVCAKQGK